MNVCKNKSFNTVRTQMFQVVQNLSTRVCSLCGAHTFCIRHFAPLKPTKKILLGFSGYQVLCGGALVFKPKVEYYYAYVPRAEYEM